MQLHRPQGFREVRGHVEVDLLAGRRWELPPHPRLLELATLLDRILRADVAMLALGAIRAPTRPVKPSAGLALPGAMRLGAEGRREVAVLARRKWQGDFVCHVHFSLLLAGQGRGSQGDLRNVGRPPQHGLLPVLCRCRVRHRLRRRRVRHQRRLVHAGSVDVLGLATRFDLALGTQVAMPTLLSVLATSGLEEPSTRSAKTVSVRGRARGERLCKRRPQAGRRRRRVFVERRELGHRRQQQWKHEQGGQLLLRRHLGCTPKARRRTARQQRSVLRDGRRQGGLALVKVAAQGRTEVQTRAQEVLRAPQRRHG
mmetsp:Transcript_20862/g.53320  ORF Transcript_20862/g.53320 Transcript_20862/m.53320 type:complete len:313 (+) Transcript_20862:1014-1952(+)